MMYMRPITEKTLSVPQEIGIDHDLSQAITATSRYELKGTLSDAEISSALSNTIEWLKAREQEFAPIATPLREFPGLAAQPQLIRLFPEGFINDISVATVDCLLPTAKSFDIGLPGLNLPSVSPSGLALENQCILVHGAPASTLPHELAHLVQFRLVGAEAYCLSYLVSAIEGGYQSCPFEEAARVFAATMFHPGSAMRDACTIQRDVLRRAYGVT